MYDFLRSMIRDIADFPKEGIIFKDITPLLKNKHAFKKVVDILYAYYKGRDIDLVVSIEARGFIFGSVLAYRLGVGFVPVRKPEKLPHQTVSTTYALEYGMNELFMHADAIEAGQNVLIIDDILATGGTLGAVASMVERLGARVVGIGLLIELLFLKGSEKLNRYDIFSIMKF